MSTSYIRYPAGAGAATSVSAAAFPLLAPDGTAGAPSYSFSSAPTYGLYWTGTVMGFSANGTFAGSITSSQIWTFRKNAIVGGLIGDLDSANTVFKIGSASLTGTTQEGMQVNISATSASTASVVSIQAASTTANAAFTTAYRAQFLSANLTKGTGSTITRDIGILINTPTQGTNNASLSDDSSAFSGNYWMYSTNTNPSLISGNLQINTVGKGLFIKEGSNAKMGTATLVAGTVDVATTAVTANSRIFLTVQSLGTVAVATPIAVTARVASTSFTITSSMITDTSVIAWMLVEPL